MFLPFFVTSLLYGDMPDQDLPCRPERIFHAILGREEY
jgi:hypothetical protein